MKTRNRAALRDLECLESRLAPAVALVNSTTATFTDADGDKATIKVSIGTLTAGLFTTGAMGLGEQLQTIDLSAGGFDGANLTISVKKALAGDGLVNVGHINSTGQDLGAVTVAGDLGQIDAGDSDPAALAVKSLTVRSMGRYGTDTQSAGGSLESNFDGALGKLSIKADAINVHVNVDDGADGTIGSVAIGGSLIGGADSSSGRIFSSGDMGPVKIGHDLQGGAGGSSGSISSLGKLAAVKVGGSAIGGANTNSGLIFSAADMGVVKIGRDLQGGTGGNSGLISSSGKLAGANIRGSVKGGAGAFSGAILSTLDMGLVKIGHDLQGGTGLSSGKIESSGTLAGVTVGGSVIGGSNTDSGQVFSIGDMGLVKIGRDLQGGMGGTTGLIFSNSKLAGVKAGGSVIGGIGADSGKIISIGDMGLVEFGRDLRGGTGGSSGMVNSTFGRLAGVTVRGSVIGATGGGSGAILSNGDMGMVNIGHDLQGSSGLDSGRIRVFGGHLAGVTVGGSVIGGSNTGGQISSFGHMGLVKIGHDLLGGLGAVSGTIIGLGNLAGVTVGGSLIGGLTSISGAIVSGGDMGLVRIGQDLQGGSISGATANLSESGAVRSGGRIASVVIGGSVISGIDSSTTGSLSSSASIRAGNDIGSLTVKGSLIGNKNPNGDSPVIISARGQAMPGATTDVAIGKVTIGRRVENARILAGYDAGLTPKNPDAQIGAVTIGGDWVASSIVAGVDDGVDNLFGTADDVKISGAGTTNSVSIVAKIASITIKGEALGTPNSTSSTDHFGFVAQQIGSLKVGGGSFALTAGPSNDSIELSPITGDLTIREVAL
jgi:hypothetical protein